VQDQTGARIFVDRENNYARVSGKPEAVARAGAKIQELMLLAADSLEQSAEGDVTKEALMLPDGFGSTLIGPGGNTVNRLQEQTGARIWVEKDSNRARVMGAPEQVSAALHLIQELLAQTGGVKAPCKWYAQGRCHRGAACGFSHTVPTHPKGTKKALQCN
jgi:polyribonucleotide nucleotidyltransferase